MAVNKKATKRVEYQYDIDDYINKGGKTAQESYKSEQKPNDLRFSLRIPGNLLKLVDEARSKTVLKLSRNQWILEAMAEKVAKENENGLD